MTDRPRRRDRARTPKRESRAVVWLVIALSAALILLGASAFLWTRAKATASIPSPASSNTAGAPAPAVTSEANAASATSAPQKSPVSGGANAPTAADAKAVEASNKAVADAAVPYPGAPALSSTMPSLNHTHPKHKYIALTLDDGYGFQPKMLDLLEQYDARCTTFLVGSWAAANKPILQRLHKDGFEIANHTWDHKILTKLSSAQVKSELARTQKVISSVTGNQAPYMRPPGGGTNSSVKAVAAGMGMRVIMWDRTFGDSGRGATPAKLYDNAVVSGGGVKPGDIILCHWGSKVSYEALKRVLPDLKAQGYEFVTISELIADSKSGN